MPDKATVLRSIGRHKEFRDHYAWAREDQADHYLAEAAQNRRRQVSKWHEYDDARRMIKI